MNRDDHDAPAIEIDGLRHDYDGRTVLALDGWRLPRAAHCLVLGASGSGKTTLLHLLAGLTSPASGRIAIAGAEIGTLSAAARDRFRARHVGLVPQRLHLIDAITVADNLRLARRLAGLAPDEARIAALLARLGVADLATRRPAALSEGQAQRAAVARALVNAPSLLLADEPTAALDDGNATTVAALLRETAAESGATLVVATHDHRIAAGFDRQLSLDAAAGVETAGGVR